MDKNLFSKEIPGRLVEIRILDELDWAFIPDCLPESMKFSENVWQLLAKAKEELGRLDGVGRHMPNHELLLKPLQHREALKSSSLEGTYATPEELLLFEVSRGKPKTGYARIDAWQEVSNYKKALRRGQDLLQSIPVSLRLIKELHKVLLSHVRGHHRTPGNYRKVQVHIGSDRRFIPPPPHEMMACLYDLERYIHSETKLDPLIFSFLVHYQFETIHPFLDGNGRVGRLLLSLMI